MPFTESALSSSNTVAEWLAIQNHVTNFLQANVVLLNEVTTGNLTLNGIAVFWANASVNGALLVSGVSDLTGNATFSGFVNVAATFNVAGNATIGKLSSNATVIAANGLPGLTGSFDLASANTIQVTNGLITSFS